VQVVVAMAPRVIPSVLVAVLEEMRDLVVLVPVPEPHRRLATMMAPDLVTATLKTQLVGAVPDLELAVEPVVPELEMAVAAVV
jgi:hypothetical protein